MIAAVHKARHMHPTLSGRDNDQANGLSRILANDRRQDAAPHMNYRHAFHAGNFADVVKHAVLARLLVHLCAQARGLSGDRHPCGRRSLRSHRPGGRAQRRMACRHRASPGRPDRGRSGGAAGALSGRGRGLQSARPARRLSGLARAGARLPARPGPSRRLRARAQRGRGARAQFRRATGASRRSRSTAGPRSTPMCRRRNGAASCSSIRRSRTRGEFPAPRARPRSRAPQMGERHLPAVVPDQGARAAGRAGAPPAALRHRQDPARRAQRRPPAAPGGLAACGLIVVNPPWTLESELAALLPALAAILAGASAAATASTGSAGEM